MMRYQKCMLQWCVLPVGLITFILIVNLYTQSTKSNMYESYNGEADRNHEGSRGLYPQKYRQRQCIEKHHIAYIKVPKTGSSTIASVLMYFGLERNLNFAIPSDGSRMFWKRPLDSDILTPLATGKHHDLLIHHSIYNRTAIEHVFPKDTVIIASVREPFAHFSSVFNYFPIYRGLFAGQNLSVVDKMELLIQKSFTAFKNGSGLSNFVIHQFNRQSTYLGVELGKYYDTDFIQYYITTELDRNLDLVLVREYFDESLVLLKRFLCWNLSDILYLSHNVHNSSTGQKCTNQTVTSHRELAQSEYMIYNFFYSKFWATVRREGLDFFDEVHTFKAIQRRVSAFCSKLPLPTQELSVPATSWGASFQITGERCSKMNKSIGVLVKKDIM